MSKFSLKIFLIVFLSVQIVLANNSSGQSLENTFLSLSVENEKVIDIFNRIETQTGYTFFYNSKLKKLHYRISLSGDQQTLDRYIQELSNKTQLSFKVIGKTISVTEPPETSNDSEGAGIIRGRVIDKENLPMIGATILVEETNIGSTVDVNGNFQIFRVPSGQQTLRVSFLGYETQFREVEVKRGEILVENFELQMQAANIAEVVVYGQARGQTAAIQQQRNSRGITNVVSAEKLRELPDVNVAEAIGRLPGLMVERNRGEGQKVIIRGLEPKYNSVSIGGNMIPSTSLDDRSTDLNLISPDILGGVEVQKANTADKDADGLGGTVNITLKEASEGLNMSAEVHSGYSGHTNNISTYRGNIFMSNRFFGDKLGVMLTGNADLSERNSDRFRVSYNVQGVPNYEEGETFIKPWVTSMNLEANVEDRTRAGGSLLFDWKIGNSSKIKASNFIGYLNRDINDRIKQYNLSGNYTYLTQFDNQVNQLLYSNSIEGEHLVLGSSITWGGSRSYTVNEKPYGHRVQFRNQGAFNNLAQGRSYDIEEPELIPSSENVNDILERYYFYNGRFDTYQAQETEAGFFLNIETPFRFGNSISGNLKLGSKYRQKNRTRSNTRANDRLDGSGSVNQFLQSYPESILTEEGVVGHISLLNFLNQDFEPNDFLNGQYPLLSVNEVLDKDMISNVYDEFLEDYYEFIPAGAKDDYDTFESILSWYAMTEINFGEYVTFIPGIRFEKTDIEYLGFIAEELPISESIFVAVDFRDTTATNSYNNFFPQLHLKISPLSWFDIRLAYTNTLSRPDYNQLAPRKLISPSGLRVTMGNTSLNPALSENYDVILSFYQPQIGFLTLGAFHKEIDGFLWNREALILADTPTAPENFDLTDATLGYTIRYPLNNPNKSTITGLEMDVQSNMGFLPVKGFVFNLNLAIMESETRYSETLLKREANPDFGIVPGAPRIIFANQDTAYVDRLLKQPSYLANFGLGYDNARMGLSVRLSFNFQDDILTREQRRPDGADREGTLEFQRWDFQFNQRITKNLSISGNVANIFNQPDRAVRLISGYTRNLEYYGTMVNVGLRYRFL
ncbi:MAG: TonB-dependent receptor [Bacteroidales bacterium]